MYWKDLMKDLDGIHRSKNCNKITKMVNNMKHSETLMMNQSRFVRNKSWVEKREIGYDLCAPWYPCTTRYGNDSRNCIGFDRVPSFKKSSNNFKLLWSRNLRNKKKSHLSPRISTETIKENRGDFRQLAKLCVRSWGIVLHLTVKKVLSAYDHTRIKLRSIYFLNFENSIPDFRICIAVMVVTCNAYSFPTYQAVIKLIDGCVT